MNTFDDSLEQVSLSPNGRRRKANKSEHAKEIAKRLRHSVGGKIPSISCQHRDSPACRAEFMTNIDLLLNQEKFYKTSSKKDQDQMIIQLINVKNAERQRVKEEDHRKSKSVTTTYNLLTTSGGSCRVCKATFCSVLGISQNRPARLANYYIRNKEVPSETRGGRRNQERDDERKEAVLQHIQTFMCRASHYGRRDSPGRKYLPSELSVAAMYRLFKEKYAGPISYSLYYDIFSKNFNLGFGHPATDVCSTCTKLRNMLRDQEVEDEVKRVKAAEFILHRRRARQFYNAMNDVGDTLTVAFDVMENLPFPRTPIGQAYYSRQLYMYVFGVVVHRQDGTQHPDDVHLYMWQENENSKDSNMIASALNHFFLNIVKEELLGKSKLRLFSDSCYGQNKNMNVVSMLFALRAQHFRNLSVQYTFPIRGHSFLPPDRVFGRLEQDIRKHPTILLPDKYVQIAQQHGRVHRYGESWEASNFKAATSAFVKQTRSFKISEAKMLSIDGPSLQVKQNYAGEYCTHSVLKKGKRWECYNPAPLPHVSTVKPVKKIDVLKLLQELHASDEVMGYYTDILSVLNEGTVNGEENDSDSS